METIRETDNYLLNKGDGAERGLFNLMDKNENTLTDWFDSSERVVDEVETLTNKEFDEEAATHLFYD